MRSKRIIFILVALLVIASLVLACAKPKPTPTPTPTPTPAPKPSPTPTPTPTPTPVPKPTPTPTPTPTPKPTMLRALMGSTGTASSHYVFAVEWAKLLNKYLPDRLQIAVVESASSWENAERMDAGEFAFSIYANYDVSYQAQFGVGARVGKPSSDLRVLFEWNWGPCYVHVREDSGITKLEELAGKKVATGPPGSLTADYTIKVFEALGIKAEVQPMSFTDGTAAIKDRRVAAYSKAFSTTVIDASTLDILSTAKVRLLPFSDEQIKTIAAKYPWIPWATVKAGWWPEFKDMPEHKTFLFPAAGGASSKMISQELGYLITKASVENYKEMVWAPFKTIKPVEDMFTNLYAMPKPPWLHAGAVQYYKEKKFDVKPSVIPPEYKP